MSDPQGDTLDTTISRRAWITLAITAAASFMVSLEITIISLALPDIRAAFPDASESALSWIITGYNIGVASLLLISGWLADRFGRKRVFLFGLAVFALGSLMAGAANSAELVIASRIVQSIGGAAQFPAGLALLLPAFPLAKRQLAIGTWGAMGGLAAAVGPSVGALLVDGFGWRVVFLVNVPVAVLALIVGARELDESVAEGVPSSVDLISVPLASIGVGAVILGIVQGEDWGWSSSQTVASFVVGAALIVVFVLRSRRHPAPLFDLELFRLRTYAVANVGQVFFVSAFFAWLVLLPTYIQSTWEWSVLRTGFAIAPSPLLSFVISPMAGRWADRNGNGPILALGGVTGAIGMALHLWLTDTTPDYLVELLLPSIFIGIAAGCSFAMLVGGALRDVPPNRFGMAGAGRTTVFQLSIALGIAIAVSIVGRPDGPDAALDAMQRSWIFALVCFVVQAGVFALAYPASGYGRATTSRRRVDGTHPNL